MAEVAATKSTSTPMAAPLLRTRWRWPFGGESVFGTSPFAMMRELSRELDRAFGSPAETGAAGAPAAAWWPAIECKRTNGSMMVTADLPGLKREDVKVEIVDNALVLEGERKFESRKEEGDYLETERSYGKFFRSIPLPEGAKADEIKAELTNGVLEVKIPVAETKPKTRRIHVEESKSK